MSKGLFKNVGRSMKRLATAIFYLTLIAYIIIALALVLYGLAEDGTGLKIACFVGAALVIGLGIFIGRLLVMQLYAFGEVTERAQSLDVKLDKVLDSLSSGKRRESIPEPGPERRPKPVDGYRAPVEPAYRPPQASRKTPWTCSYCGCENTAGTVYCTNCGGKRN